MKTSTITRLLMCDFKSDTIWDNNILGVCKLNISINLVWFSFEESITDHQLREIDNSKTIIFLKDGKEEYSFKNFRIVANPIKIGNPYAGWKDVIVFVA